MLGSPDEAEDVLQQTFAAAYTALLADEREIALKPWLYAIARNGCLSELRGQREHLALEDGDARLPATVGLSAEVEQREDLRALLSDLQRLPEDQRAALILAELGAETHEEIALVLGVPAVKVKALVFQAREALMSRRLARDSDCGPIREQLSFLRGGARRRRELRNHVAQCAGCQAFDAETKRQRAGMAVLLPVAPTFALKQSSLAAAFAAGGGGAAGVGGAAAGGAAAGSVAAGSAAVGGAGGTYSVVGGAVAGTSAAGGATAGGAASVGGVAMLSGTGTLAGAKLLGLKALVGLALTGASAGGYTIVQSLPNDSSAPPAQASTSAPNQSQKAAPKPPAGLVAPIGLSDCRKPGAATSQCAAKSASDPAPGGAGAAAASAPTGDLDADGVPNSQDPDRDGDGVPNTQDPDRDGDGVPNTQDGDTAPGGPAGAAGGESAPAARPGDRDGDGIPNTADGDRDGDGVPNSQDTCPNKPGTADGCPVAPGTPRPGVPAGPAGDRDGDGVPNTEDGDRDGDGVPNGQDKCPSRPGTADGCPAATASPDPTAPTVAKPDRDGDGVPNNQDDDRDGDGVSNGEDKCPNRPGTADGCPVEVPANPLPVATLPEPGDRDSDGVPNREDNCPVEPGPGDGCPDVPDAVPGDPTPGDLDGDGIPNGKDRDRDGDGSVNREDNCPIKAGTVDGCPVEPPAPLPDAAVDTVP